MVNLKIFRFVNNLTQDDLARFLGMTNGNVSKIESGSIPLKEEHLIKILTNDKGWKTDMLAELSPLMEKLEQKNENQFNNSSEVIELRAENKLLREQLDRALGIIEKFASSNK